MVSRTKVAWLTVPVLVSLVLVVLSMSLALAGEDEFDVGVFKSDDPESVIAGDSLLTYTILVTNSQWGITATNVHVTDTLPSGVNYVGDTGGCSEDSGVLSCPVADLDPGEEISFTIEVDVEPYAYNPWDDTICNNVEVSATTGSGGGDTYLANNAAEECTDVEGWADLTMEKTVFPGDVVPVGEWFSYTLWLENLGPSASAPVVMDWFATDGSLTAVWTNVDEYGYRGPMACGPMPTEQGWAETPVWLLNWVDTVCDLTGDPWFCDAIEPWWEAWWAYWYNSFPPNYPYPLAVDWMCIWYPWNFEPLDGLWPGEPISVTIDVLPLDAQTIYNQAWIVPDMFPYNWMDWGEDYYNFYDYEGVPDPDPYNNMDELTTFVTDEADLQVIKTSKPDDQVDAGLPFTYTIFVENLGPAPATEVSIRDEMLSSGSFDILDVILDPSRDDEGPVELPSPVGGRTMEFHLLEPLEPKGPDNQGRWVIQMVLQAAETQDVNNMVQVFTREGGSFDPDLSNNQDEDRIAVGDVADLGIEKWWEEAPFEWFDEMPYAPEDCYLYDEGLVGVRAGCPLRYQLEVTSTGPSLAENVVVEDILPTGVTVEGVGPSQGSCTTGIPGDPSAPLTCNLGNIPPGEGAGIEVFVMTDVDLAWELLENDALVYSDILDPDNGNNRSHVLVWVEPFSYLYLDKEGPPEILAGEEIEYWIHLRNEGPSTAHNVYLDDELPGGVSLVGADVMVGDGSCVPGSALCSLGDIEPWEGRGVRVRAYVEPWLEAGTLVTNTVRAWAHSPFFQPIPDEPISDTWETLVNSEADLSIRKTSDPYKVYAGEQKRYDIEVTNHGPGVAYNVVVSDTLDPGVEFEISTTDCGLAATGPGALLGSSGYGGFMGPGAPGELFSVDHTTAAATLIGQMLGGPLATEIEYDPNTGLLYAAEVNVGNPYLHNIDPSSGATLSTAMVGPYPGDPVVAGMEFVGSTLYATVHDWMWSANSALYTLNPSTGLLTAVGAPTPYLQITGLAYDQASGTMYGVAPGAPATLLTINLSTGVATPVGPIMAGATPLAKVGSIEFGPDGNLYGGLASGDSNWPDFLVRIDTSTAAATLVGDTGYPITGLTLAGTTGDLVCNVGDIPPGETAMFSIWARVKPDTLGMIHNRVDVFSESEDPNPDNDWDTEANLVLGKADLKVTKFGKPDGEVRAGEELEYWVIVDNLGPGFAHDVVLYDIIASDGEFALWYGDGDGGEYDCQVDGCYQDNGYYVCDEDAQLSCRLNDPLPVMSPNSPGRWLVKVWVEAWEEQSINNVAHVVSSDFDPDLSNNQAVAEHDITAVADLSLGKEAWGEVLVDCDEDIDLWENEVAAGGTLEYTVWVDNLGPSTAENVVVEDWGLSPFLDIIDVQCEKDGEDPGDGCSCNTSELGDLGDLNRRLVCYLGTIEWGDEDQIRITARIPSDVPEGTLLVNDAKVYGDVLDDYNGNNLATNWTTVIRTADFAVEKTQEPEIALPGWDITYSITVTNLGLSDAEGVIISDTIPVQVLDPTWTCCASDDGECDVPCEPPVCPEEPCPWPEIGLYAQADIPAGEWVIYTVEGTLDWWPCGPFTNTVEVIAPQSLVHPEMDIDPCDENNIDIAVNDPICHFDPLVLKAFPGPDSTD